MIFVKHVQREPTSALTFELHGSIWSIEGQLLANIYDATAQANWQRAGKKHAPKPKPIERPWDAKKSTSIGSDPIPISQFNDWWDSAGP